MKSHAGINAKTIDIVIDREANEARCEKVKRRDTFVGQIDSQLDIVRRNMMG